MAARYVNPDNVTAQGQYFYTGLLPGSYDTGGAGGGNVYVAGSGGSAGVAADRTGSDSSKTWDYKANFSLNFGRMTNPPTSGKKDPSDGGEAPPRGKRTPVGNGGPVDTQHFPVVSGRERWGADGKMVRLGPNEVDPMARVDPAGPFGEKPKMLGPGPSNQGPSTSNQGPGGPGIADMTGMKPMLALPQYSEPTRARMDRRNTADRARRASMMPAKDFAFGMEALASSEGTQGMWGAFSASRSHSRPRTF